MPAATVCAVSGVYLPHHEVCVCVYYEFILELSDNLGYRYRDGSEEAANCDRHTYSETRSRIADTSKWARLTERYGKFMHDSSIIHA